MHNFRFHGSGHENKPTVYETTTRTSHVGVTKSGQLFRATRKYFAKLPGQGMWPPWPPPSLGPALVEWLQKPITGRNTLMCVSASWGHGDFNFYKSLAFRTFIELFLYVNWLHNFCHGKCRVAGMATQTQPNPYSAPALFYTGLLSVDFQIRKRTFPARPNVLVCINFDSTLNAPSHAKHFGILFKGVWMLRYPLTSDIFNRNKTCLTNANFSRYYGMNKN